MSQLRKLSVAHNRDISTRGLNSLSQLRHLAYLRMEYNDTGPETREKLPCLCQITIRSQPVNNRGLSQLIVVGWYKFPLPESWGGGTRVRRQLVEAEYPSAALKHFNKMRSMQQQNTTEDLVLTINNNMKPTEDGKCQLTWKLTILNQSS